MRLLVWLLVAGCSSTPVPEPVSGSAEVRSVPTFWCIAYTSEQGSWCLPDRAQCDAARDLILTAMPVTEESMPPCGPANAASCFAHTARGEAQEQCSMTMDHCEREQASGSLAPVTVPCRLVRRP